MNYLTAINNMKDGFPIWRPKFIENGFFEYKDGMVVFQGLNWSKDDKVVPKSPHIDLNKYQIISEYTLKEFENMCIDNEIEEGWEINEDKIITVNGVDILYKW